MQKTFQAELDDLYKMMEFVRNKAKEVGFPYSFIINIELAVEEALVNVINYAYPDEPGEIQIICTPTSPIGLEVVIKDRGIPYDPVEYENNVDPTVPLEERRLGGYGIFFIKKIMDTVSYQRVDDFNVLTLTKYNGIEENKS